MFIYVFYIRLPKAVAEMLWGCVEEEEEEEEEEEDEEEEEIAEEEEEKRRRRKKKKMVKKNEKKKRRRSLQKITLHQHRIKEGYAQLPLRGTLHITLSKTTKLIIHKDSLCRIPKLTFINTLSLFGQLKIGIYWRRRLSLLPPLKTSKNASCLAYNS